jgi:hypothetical protein
VADETTRRRATGATVPPVRARPDPAPGGDADGSGPGRTGATPTTERPPRVVQVAGRAAGDVSRTSPRMRFDLLQLAAWTVGLGLVVAGLVALARAGFDDLGLFEPVVEVGGQAATPLYAVLWLVGGAVVLAAGTGAVNERRLRLAGVVSGVVGAVFLLEPTAFTDHLGVSTDSGTPLLAVGALLAATSFVPPLWIARPGIARG